MAFCSNCGAQMNDGATFCEQCGAQNANAQNAQNTQGVPPVAPVSADSADHTAEFDPKDISDNKVIAMSTYLLGIVGIIIALLAAHDSKYAAFHSRQSLKLTLVSTLLVIVALILCWTIIVPIAAGVCLIIVFVLQIIGFFNVCSGKAKELPIIRSFGFLK